MKKQIFTKKTAFDLCLIIGLLLLAGLISLAFHHGSRAGGWAVVRVDGQVTGRYSLQADGSYPLNGGSNYLVIEKGEAWLSEANCPDKLCVKQGRIRYTGQSIVCLPNRLTVTVEGGQTDGVDGTVG